MSNTFVLFSLLIIYVALKHVTAKPTDDLLFTETVYFQHENGKWTCGDIQCPDDTFGCKISIKNDDDDKKILYQSFNCLDTSRQIILGSGDIINTSKAREVDIELETYEGAISVYSTGYGMDGREHTKGVVAVTDLNELKESAKNYKKTIIEFNAQKE